MRGSTSVASTTVACLHPCVGDELELAGGGGGALAQHLLVVVPEPLHLLQRLRAAGQGRGTRGRAGGVDVAGSLPACQVLRPTWARPADCCPTLPLPHTALLPARQACRLSTQPPSPPTLLREVSFSAHRCQ